MTDEQLREAYRRAVATRGPSASGSRDGCPAPEALETLVRRDGAEPARLATLEHVMSCASCRSEFELLRAIEVARAREMPARRLHAWRRPLTLALAASVMFAAVLGPGRSVWRDWRSDATRGDATGIALVLPADGATAGAEPVRFVWRPVEGATAYTLEVMTVDGALMHGASTRDTTLVVPELASLAAGEYRWWVRTQVAGGEVRSELQSISVRGR